MKVLILVLSLAACLCLPSLAASTAASPTAASAASVIHHDPVRVAIPGQSISVRASITGEEPRSVSLFFTPSRDVAPFRLPMNASGNGVYAGSIPELNLAGLTEVYYYLEVRDSSDTPIETPWYTVRIQAPSAASTSAAQRPATVQPSSRTDEGGSSWVKPALIGAGALAAGGIGYAVYNGSSGGDDGDSSTPPPDSSTNSVGTYSGTETTCTQDPTTGTSCDSSGFKIVINAQGGVRTDDLRDGTTMEGTLSGSSFILVADVDENGFVGEIQYIGAVVDNRIVGSIQGSAQDAAGAVVTYTGNFSGVKL